MADKLARSGFDMDLAFGEARESAFVEALRDCHVECKSDQKLRVTGKAAVEIRQGNTLRGKGRPSGLSVTTARWWAIEFADDRWLVFRTSELKAIVRSIAKEHGTVMGGDGDRYELVLVPIAKLIQPVMVLP